MMVVNGDITQVTEGCIVHQVNCCRVMGAGLALQIRRKWPEHYHDFVEREPRLGAAFGTQVGPRLFVCGVYGQKGYGRNGVQTDYAALEHGLALVAKSARNHNLPVYVPYKIGCGLAGGDWDVVERIIARTIPDAIIIKK